MLRYRLDLLCFLQPCPKGLLYFPGQVVLVGCLLFCLSFLGWTCHIHHIEHTMAQCYTDSWICSQFVLIHAITMIICLKIGIWPNPSPSFCCLSSPCTPAFDSVALTGDSCKCQTINDVLSKKPYRMKQICLVVESQVSPVIKGKCKVAFCLPWCRYRMGPIQRLCSSVFTSFGKKRQAPTYWTTWSWRTRVLVEQLAKLSHKDAYTSQSCMKKLVSYCHHRHDTSRTQVQERKGHLRNAFM